MIELKSGSARLGILPDCGGALSHWLVEGREIFHPVADPNLVAQRMRAVAAYPLIPFSSRVGMGRFTFEGKSYQLDSNFAPEPHAIHGNGWERTWKIEHQEEVRALLVLDHRPPVDPVGQWPFCYHARLYYELGDGGLRVTLSIENTDTRNQPVGLGFHPFFPRHSAIELEFSALSVWESGADNLPLHRQEVTGDWSFAVARPVGGALIDNCYNEWDRKARIIWPDEGRSLSFAASGLAQHLVLYTPPGQPYIACEPVTNMNDGFNHPEIGDNGVHILQPGQSISLEVLYELQTI